MKTEEVIAMSGAPRSAITWAVQAGHLHPRKVKYGAWDFDPGEVDAWLAYRNEGVRDAKGRVRRATRESSGPSPELLTRRQVIEMAGCTVHNFRDARRFGYLSPVRVATRLYYYRLDEVQEWMKRRQNRAAWLAEVRKRREDPPLPEVRVKRPKARPAFGAVPSHSGRDLAVEEGQQRWHREAKVGFKDGTLDVRGFWIAEVGGEWVAVRCGTPGVSPRSLYVFRGGAWSGHRFNSYGVLTGAPG